MEYGTKYTFRQGEILHDLSERMQNYFIYMLNRFTDRNWLKYLIAKKDKALLEKFGAMNRYMWCTGGFFHAAGKTVTPAGHIIPLHNADDSAVFTFDPISITCSESGITEWTHDKNSKNRFIFHVRNTDNYKSAMTKAMKSLLMTLP